MEIVAIAENEPEDPQSELVGVLLSIVTSFSARLYGARGSRKVRQGFRELIPGVALDEKGENDETD